MPLWMQAPGSPPTRHLPPITRFGVHYRPAFVAPDDLLPRMVDWCRGLRPPYRPWIQPNGMSGTLPPEEFLRAVERELATRGYYRSNLELPTVGNCDHY